jgi:magnesium-protoporphyrin O-methyltransferase
MPRCCSTSAYGEFFDEKLARRDAEGYRTRGLKGAGKRLVELIAARGVDGADVLEVGGGIGALQLELLRRGAAHTTNAELSPAYEGEAVALLEERALTQRVDRRIVDIATDPDVVQPADVVLLHRVVCCYPDYERLLGTAARKARRLVAFSFPPDHVATRAAIFVLNLWPRVRRCDFRSYVHPEREMLAAVERNGFRVVSRERSGIWRIALLERAS